MRDSKKARVLLALARGGPMDRPKLASTLGERSCAATVDGLHREGLIMRGVLWHGEFHAAGSGVDGPRRLRYHLTDKGWGVVRELRHREHSERVAAIQEACSGP